MVAFIFVLSLILLASIWVVSSTFSWAPKASELHADTVETGFRAAEEGYVGYVAANGGSPDPEPNEWNDFVRSPYAFNPKTPPGFEWRFIRTDDSLKRRAICLTGILKDKEEFLSLKKAAWAVGAQVAADDACGSTVETAAASVEPSAYPAPVSAWIDFEPISAAPVSDLITDPITQEPNTHGHPPAKPARSHRRNPHAKRKP